MTADWKWVFDQNGSSLKLHTDLLAFAPRRSELDFGKAGLQFSVRVAATIVAMHVLGIAWVLFDQSEQMEIPHAQTPMMVSLLQSPTTEAKEVVETPQVTSQVNKQQPIERKTAADKQSLVQKQKTVVTESVPDMTEPAKEMITQTTAVQQNISADMAEVSRTAETQSIIKDMALEQQVVTRTAEVNTQAELQVEPPKFGAAYLNNPAPEYPALARRKGEQGRVLLKVLVSETGLAQKVQIDTSSGYDKLDQAAVEAVKKWSFIPARRSNQAVSAYVLVPIKFSLNS